MGTLVLDIENASPFEEPPDKSNNTQYFEFFAVSLACADGLNDTPKTEVLFRRGDWNDQHIFPDWKVYTLLGSTTTASGTTATTSPTTITLE